MKNIETILSEVGIELTDEQKKAIVDGVAENYKTINDWQKQVDKVSNLTQQLTTTKDELKKFDGVDAEGLKKQIADLEQKLKDADADYQTKLADRDFDDLIESEIRSHKGINAKAIRSLLDIDALKTSKNQKNDVASAIKKLTEAEDSKMLFGSAEPEKKGSGSPIGSVSKGSAEATAIAKARAVMGLPPIKED